MPSEFGPVRRLVEEAFRAPRIRAKYERLCAAADVLDARSAWPTGEQAAEQLAQAMREWRNNERERDGWPRRAWESYSEDSQAEFIADAAAVLQRLAGAQGEP